MGRRFALGLAIGAVAFATVDAGALAASGFVPPESLGGTGTALSVVQTAMASNGFAIAGWSERLSGGQSAIEVATRPPGGPWSSAQQLDLGATPKSPSFPVSVAIDTAGDAAIAWDDQPTMSSNNALVSTRAAGQQAFGAPQTQTGASDPAVGIDGSGHVTMIDVEDPTATKTELARTWPAGTAMPPFPATNLATGCSSFFPADLAVAPSGDAIVGMTCGSASTGGAMFARRQRGTWQPTVTLASNTSSGTCGTFDFRQNSAQQTAVAIDGQGNPAGVFIDDNTSGCVPNAMDAYSLMLVLPGVAGLHVATTVDTSSTPLFLVGTSLMSPQIAVGGGSEAIAWSRNNFTPIGQDADVRFYDSAGAAAGVAQTLESGSGVAPRIALAPSGLALAVVPTHDGTGLQAGVRPPGGAFALTALASNAGAGSVAIDDAGDGVAAYVPTATGATGAQARGFDATAPTIGSASIPAAASVGRPATFAATGTDFWGPVTLSWTFGDGGSAIGGTVSHAFTTPGAHSITVTATDAVGNAATRTGTITAAAIPPVLSKVSQTHGTFRVGSAPTPIVARAGKHRRRAPVGTTFVFTLSEAAGVSIRITHAEPGRRSGHACVKPTRKLRSHKRCTRTVIDGTLRRSGVAGTNRVAFSGRIARRALHPGSYLLTLTASEFGLASRTRKLNFRIVR
jgi:PKD domain